MKRVDPKTFRQIVRWLRGATNYMGGRRHEMDTVSHYMQVDGEAKLAAQEADEEVTHGISSGPIYLVNEEVYSKWREKFGYKISF